MVKIPGSKSVKFQKGSTVAIISEKTGNISYLKKAENGRWKKDPGKKPFKVNK